MAQFSIDFSGETTGAAPANFTERWTATGDTWAVREKAGTLGGKCLEHTRTTTANRAFSWDTPGSDTNSEILVRWRTDAPTSTGQFWLTLRGSGAGGSEGGYIFRNTSGTAVQVGRMVAGTFTAIGATATISNLVSGEWYWLRFRVNGTDLKAKIWAGENVAEPSAWTIERTDATIAGAGWIAVGNAAATGTRDYDDIAVGTAGDTAVFPVSDEARITQQATLVLSAADSDTRVTQLVALALAEQMDIAPARITQLATLVMYEPMPMPYITQATALVLAEYDADIRVTQLAALVLADHVPCLTRWAQCWTITRTDGEVFAFTSLDRPLTFRGVVHYPCRSLQASAVELSTIVGVTGSMELRGILSDSGVSEADLYNGLFDGANIEIWMVPWDNSGGEIPFRLMAGVTGANSIGDTDFSQEILTPSAQLQQKALLETYTPGCRYSFGNQVDPRCPVDLVALTVSGSVTGTPIPNASTNATRRIFTDSTRAEADGFYNQGTLTWTSGPNAGAVSEVKDFTAGQFILWEALLFPIALTDAYDLTPSCDKSPASHLQFNADMVDFGGFPHVPGGDALVNTPDSRG